MAKIRLGLTDSSIVRPLTWAILRGEHRGLFERSVLPPGRIAPLLAEGALDVGLVAGAEALEAGLDTIPDLGVQLRAEGAVALLEWRRSPDAARTACTDVGCAALGALAGRYLESTLGRRVGSRPPSAADVVLHSAFDAVLPEERGEEWTDVATGWFDREREEPVLHLWGYRSGVDIRDAEFALKSSLRLALKSLPAVCRELAAQTRMPSEHLERLFAEGLRFYRASD